VNGEIAVHADTFWKNDLKQRTRCWQNIMLAASRQMRDKYQARGERMPVAVVCGDLHGLIAAPHCKQSNISRCAIK
jgi:hypothetical protein